ncbi:hypothetical protein BJV74DRAFT_793998 [Russula compacta]|nr:hypothetical protein BJV74DRAFT_793998 [Russula compacta]
MIADWTRARALSNKPNSGYDTFCGAVARGKGKGCLNDVAAIVSLALEDGAPSSWTIGKTVPGKIRLCLGPSSSLHLALMYLKMCIVGNFHRLPFAIYSGRKMSSVVWSLQVRRFETVYQIGADIIRQVRMNLQHPVLVTSDGKGRPKESLKWRGIIIEVDREETSLYLAVAITRG